MKRIFKTLMCLLITFGLVGSINAEVVTEDWKTFDAEEKTIATNHGVIELPTNVGGSVSYVMDETPITTDAKSYEVIIDLSSKYEHGYYFTTSLGVGVMNVDVSEYKDEFCVNTQKINDEYEIHANVAPGKTITVEPGVYTYRYTIQKLESGTKDFRFTILDSDGKVVDTLVYQNSVSTYSNLQDSTVIRRFWIFGPGADPSTYQLTSPLTLYTEMPKPTVAINGLTNGGTYKVGDVVEFDVQTTINTALEGYKTVKGYTDLLISNQVATIEYLDDKGNDDSIDDEWVALTTNTFGSASGFAFTNTSYKFRATFIKEGELSFNAKFVEVGTSIDVVSTDVSLTVQPKPEVKPSPACKVNDKNCDGVISCEEEKGQGWEWNNTKKVCEFKGSTKTYIVNTATK